MTRRIVPPLQPGWVIAGGQPVYHRSSTPERRDAGGETADEAIVHLHGFGISGSYLEPTAALLADRYPTYVPDLPGFGLSRVIGTTKTLDLDGLGRAVVDYLDAIGVERATLVGNSLGCPVIGVVAATHPERVRRAVLVSPAGGPNNQPMARALWQLAKDGPREKLSMLPIATADYLRFGPHRGWSLFRAMLRHDALSTIAALTMPTLVIVGERDPLVNLDRAWIFDEYDSVRLVVIPGAHALNFSHPESVAALIGDHMV